MSQQTHIPERRTVTRVPIERDVTYTIFDTKNGNEVGVGKTLNMSSKSICFSAEHVLQPNTGLDLLIDWPPQEASKSPRSLLAHGRIIGCSNGIVSMEIQNVEFHEWHKPAKDSKAN